MELLCGFSPDWTLTDTVISLVALGMDLWVHSLAPPLVCDLGQVICWVKWNNACACLAQIASNKH